MGRLWKVPGDLALPYCGASPAAPKEATVLSGTPVAGKLKRQWRPPGRALHRHSADSNGRWRTRHGALTTGYRTPFNRNLLNTALQILALDVEIQSPTGRPRMDRPQRPAVHPGPGHTAVHPEPPPALRPYLVQTGSVVVPRWLYQRNNSIRVVAWQQR
ncbi:unnamed protein product [Gadus morhua 'NCC']